MNKLHITILFMMICSFNASGHKYFFAHTEITTNKESHAIEVIHEISLHDIEYAIALTDNIRFTPETEDYEERLQQYIEQHFSLEYNEAAIPLYRVGLALTKDKATFYQESKKAYFLNGLVVKNHLLVDTYPTQVNIVSYTQGQATNSLTFTSKQRINIIK